MSTEAAKPADDRAKAAETAAAEGLSQFVARVLNQLSLSAWLPAAALVLALALILRLGTVLDADSQLPTWTAITKSISGLAHISFGGALVLFASVIVLTIFTQAFSFEAIRTLEGYWGTNRGVQRLADWRCEHHDKVAENLRSRYQDLTVSTWRAARAGIEEAQSKAIQAGDTDNDVRAWTPDMLTYLGAKVTGDETDVKLSPADRVTALGIPWQRYAPARELRRQVDLDKRLRDYPHLGRTLPTRLGNVLRTHEDQTGRLRVETMVLEIYEQLPLALRVQHDEHRNRLDLYASMVFVEGVVIGVGVARLVSVHPSQATLIAVVGIAFMWLTNRAAVASARVYGILIVDLSRRYPNHG